MDAAVEDVTGRVDGGAAAAEAQPAPAGPGRGRSPRPGTGLLVALLAAVNLPVVVATVRALSHGWQPMGDNGILLVRARDVGTGHHPLLGTWTSASMLYGTDINNPGPLYFDALALPVRALGPWVGLAVGVMLINMAASSFAVVVGRRIAGRESMVAVGVVVVALQFAMGSELLFDVWQPNALVLPFVAFLVAAMALATGDAAMGPWVVGIGSLVVQTHFSHAVLAGVVAVVATGMCVLALRRREPGAWRRPLAWSAVVFVLAWSQPVIEQLTGAGDGNMTRIAQAVSDGGATPIGWDRAPRIMAEVMVRGPWFTRDAYGRGVPPIGPDAPAYGTVTMGPAVAVLAMVAAALVLVGIWSRRTGRRGLFVLAAAALAAMAAVLVALAMAPVSALGISLHQMRWLWPVAAVVTAALLAALLSSLRSWPKLANAALVAGCVVALAVAAANLPTFLSRSKGPTSSASELADGRDLVGQLGALEGRGTILYDPRPLRFSEPYSGMTFAELQDRGIPFVFDDEGFVRQFGESRRNDGTADLRMWQVSGAEAAEIPPGAERVAYAETERGSIAIFVAPID